MSSRIEEYLALRRKLGFELGEPGRVLRDFGRYADGKGHRGPITIDLAVEWARLPEAASPSYLAHRLTAVRCFAKHCLSFDPRTQIPPRGLIVGSYFHRSTPYIYSPAEIAAILETAARLSPSWSPMPRTYAYLFGLLASTGLRISEALRLTRADVDLDAGVLTITRTKFKKSRLVPVHPSTAKALREYARFRDQRFPFTTSPAFFLNSRVVSLKHGMVSHKFRTVCRILGIGSGRRAPRIHDLRHTFAVRRLLRWYQEGADIDNKIPTLSTYLGHVGVKHTYWYLTAVPELMAITSARFERFAHYGEGGRP
jgi:integrase